MTESKTDLIGEYRDEKGRFVESNPGGPGRPKITEEERLMKAEVKKYIENYLEGLTKSLPSIQPIIIDKALKGDMIAIKEIHDRVMGKAVTPIVADVEHKFDLTDLIRKKIE